MRQQFALCIAASAVILAAFLEGLFPSAYSMGLILVTLLGIPVGWLLVRSGVWVVRKMDGIDVFSPFMAFPIAYVIWFGLGAVTFLLDLNPPRYLYFVLGLLAYLAGTLAMYRKSSPIHTIHTVPTRVPWDPSHFRFAMMVFFLLMTGSYLWLIAQIGIPAIHADVGLRRAALSPHHYLLAMFQSSAWTLMLFAAADLWSSERILASFVSGGIVSLAGLMLASFGNRGFLVVPILSLLIFWHYWKKRIRAGRLPVILVAVFMAAAAYQSVRARPMIEEIGESGWSDMFYSSAAFMLHTSLSNFRDIVETIPSEVPYQHGYLTFGVLAQVFPGHHESSDLFFKRILASNFIGGGQPGTVLAPFYGDFGVIGIVVGMFLFGAFSVKAHVWMREKPTLLRVLLYSWLAQTAILSVYGALVTYIITLWLPFFWWVLQRWMRVVPEAL